MNIFVPYPDPKRCAQALDNKRLNKMIVETGQILSTAMRTLNSPYSPPYGSFNPKHPCCIWAAQSRENFIWLTRLLNELLTEKKFRYPLAKPHSIEFTKYTFELFAMGHFDFPSEDRTEFPNCTNDKRLNIDFRYVPEVHKAYQQYLIFKWLRGKSKPSWGRRGQPEFFTEVRKSLGMEY